MISIQFYFRRSSFVPVSLSNLSEMFANDDFFNAAQPGYTRTAYLNNLPNHTFLAREGDYELAQHGMGLARLHTVTLLINVFLKQQEILLALPSFHNRVWLLPSLFCSMASP